MYTSEVLMTADGYIPSNPASRVTAFLVIVGVHAAALATVATARHIAIRHEHEPILVKVLPESPRPRTLEARTVPLPPLVMPEIRLPAPPPIENLYTTRVEDKKPAPVAAVVTASPNPSPPVEAPRFDMAYLNNPPPSYPAASRRVREEGRVMLRVHVDASGSVDSIEIQRTSGFPRLDEAALAAVRRWRFHPARSGDRAIGGWAIVPVNFRLS